MSSFRPESPGPGWALGDGTDAFDSATTYLAYGFTDDDEGSTAHVAFTPGDISSLTPSTVLVSGDRPAQDVVGRSRFEDLACEVSE